MAPYPQGADKITEETETVSQLRQLRDLKPGAPSNLPMQVSTELNQEEGNLLLALGNAAGGLGPQEGQSSRKGVGRSWWWGWLAGGKGARCIIAPTPVPIWNFRR